MRTVVTGNGGPAAARNLGARLAQAPYVAYLDSDNSWLPNYLATMYAAIEARPDARLWYCGQETTIWQRSTQGVWTHRFTGVEPRAQYGLADAFDLRGADANCMVHRRGLLDEIGGWDENCRWLEDWDFFLRCMLHNAAGVVWVDAVLVAYRQVHGTGADGICGEARQDGDQEFAARHYLLQKWGEQLTPAAVQKLSMSVDALLARRDRAARKYEVPS